MPDHAEYGPPDDRRSGGLPWEELEPGRDWRTRGRLVTQGDVDDFARLSGDWNALHVDEAYARETVYGGRIAHGVLGLAVATGLLNELRLTAGTLVGLLGVEWDFRKPVRPGTTVHARVSVASRRESSDPARGHVVLEVALAEGDGTGEGDVLQEGRLKLLVRRRDGSR